jgi:hypothetical protein
MSAYPERRFFLMLEGGKELNGAMAAHLATPAPEGYVLYEAIPKAHLDAVHALIEALENDEQIQEGMCSGQLKRAFDALPSELREQP